MRTTDALRLAAIVAVVAGLTGCGSGRVQTYPVVGTVTAGGRPATGVVVALIPVDPQKSPLTSCPRGEVGADGRYTLTTFSIGDGAPADEYKVTLRWPTELDGKSKSLAEAQGEGGDIDRLKSKYADPNTSPWTVTIKPGDNTLDPLTITER